MSNKENEMKNVIIDGVEYAPVNAAKGSRAVGVVANHRWVSANHCPPPPLPPAALSGLPSVSYMDFELCRVGGGGGGHPP